MVREQQNAHKGGANWKRLFTLTALGLIITPFSLINNILLLHYTTDHFRLRPLSDTTPLIGTRWRGVVEKIFDCKSFT